MAERPPSSSRIFTRPWPVGVVLFLARRLSLASFLTCPCPVGPNLLLASRLSREGFFTRPWPVGPSLFLARRLSFASSLTCPCPVGPGLFLAIRLSREGSFTRPWPRCFTAEREAAEFVEATGRFMGKAVLPPSSSIPRLVCNNHKQPVRARIGNYSDGKNS